MITGQLTIGTVVAFVFYLGRLYGPASALVSAHVGIMTAVALFRRIFEYLDLPVEIADPAKPMRLAAVIRKNSRRPKSEQIQRRAGRMVPGGV